MRVTLHITLLLLVLWAAQIPGVAQEDSKVAVLALATNEELIVARRAYRCLCGAG